MHRTLPYVGETAIFLTKFKFWVGHFIVVLSIRFFGFPEQIFIEIKGGKNISEGII